MLAGPKTDPASRSGTAQPPVRKSRVLPSAFSPDRTACGPERPACANPRQGWQIRAPRLDFSRPKGGPQDLAKHSKIHYRKPRFCVWITVRLVLSPATRGDGPLAAGCPRSYVNLQALRDPAPRIPDSVGISRKRRIKSYVVLRAWRGPAPRFFDSVGKSKN